MTFILKTSLSGINRWWGATELGEIWKSWWSWSDELRYCAPILDCRKGKFCLGAYCSVCLVFFLLEWTMKHLFCALFILCRNRYDDFWLLGYVWVDFIRKKNLVAIFNSLRHNISTSLRAIECHWFAKYSGTLFPRIFVVILFAVYFLKDILNKDYYYQSRLWFLQFRLQRCIQKVRI